MRFDEGSGIKNVDYWRFIIIYRFFGIEDSVGIYFNKIISIDTIFIHSISIDWLNKWIWTTIYCLNLLRMIWIPDSIFK